MNVLNIAMRKKQSPHYDMHINSSINLQMDSKARLLSQYQKKYDPQHYSKASLNLHEKRPAGTKNFYAPSQDNEKHLNASRRRILNDFLAPRHVASSTDMLANRNMSLALKLPSKLSMNLSKYDYKGPLTVIGPSPAGAKRIVAVQHRNDPSDSAFAAYSLPEVSQSKSHNNLRDKFMVKRNTDALELSTARR